MEEKLPEVADASVDPVFSSSLTSGLGLFKLPLVQEVPNSSSKVSTSTVAALLQSPLPRTYLNFVGRKIIHAMDTVHGLVAFGLIAFGVAATKFNHSARVIHPLILAQVFRVGVRLLPMIGFMAVALGLIVVGQGVSLLTRFGADSYVGMLMVVVVVREIGPLLTAMIVLARVGTATVVELGTARALGEVEALEALGIDPIHFLVLPRMIGMAVAISALTVYTILIALFSGYLFAFLQDVPLPPSEYFRQVASALRWEDFVFLALKTISFGLTIAIVTCYQGLARPLRIEEVPSVTTTAVLHCVVACVLVDALFIVIYLLI